MRLIRSLMLLGAFTSCVPLMAKGTAKTGHDQPYGALAFRALGPLVGGGDRSRAQP